MKTLIPIILVIVVVGGIMYFNSNKKASDSEMSSNIPGLTGEEVSKSFEGTFVFDTEASTASGQEVKKL